MSITKKKINVAITEASYSGNKGAAAMLQSSISQLYKRYGEDLNICLFSVWPGADRKLVPWKFVQIVPSEAWKTVFITFPMAVLYRLFRWCRPIRNALLGNPMLEAYSKMDLVLDEAGVSFVDSRGFVMNTFAFICMAIPLLMGVPVVKYSQAMGTFDMLPNRIQAKIILPKMKLILARGEITRKNLEQIGIRKNVRMCADGAFTMEDDPEVAQRVAEVCRKDAFYSGDKVVGISPSTVVNKKCRKEKIDYVRIMTEFIDHLTEEGWNVLIVANAARENTSKTRNNDLPICSDIYRRCRSKDHVRYYNKEMCPEEIREYIGKCRFFVASRFHAMVFSLERKVPVLLIGWSHKYQEVLDYFSLGKYARDYSELSTPSVLEGFHQLEAAEDEIREKLDRNYDHVIESSRKNITYTAEILDQILLKKAGKSKKNDRN